MFVNVSRKLLLLFFPRRYFYFISVLVIIALTCLYWDSAVSEASSGERHNEKTNTIRSINSSTVSSKTWTLKTRGEPESTRINRKTNVTEKPSKIISKQIGQEMHNTTTTTELPTERSYHFRVKRSAAAARLPSNGSLFCWVLTTRKYFNYKVPAVNETWLKRCDHGEFYTTEPIDDESIPFSTVFTGLNDSYDELFHKSIRAIHFSYTHLSKDFDWYFKADDDTYVIVENLREFLSKYDPKPNGFNSGGAGYVLSNAAVKLFVEELYNNRTLCPFDKFEDVGIARCLANMKIYPTQTSNSRNEERFCYTTIDKALKKPNDMRIYDYLLYRVKRNHINTTIPN